MRTADARCSPILNWQVSKLAAVGRCLSVESSRKIQRLLSGMERGEAAQRSERSIFCSPQLIAKLSFGHGTVRSCFAEVNADSGPASLGAECVLRSLFARGTNSLRLKMCIDSPGSWIRRTSAKEVGGP